MKPEENIYKDARIELFNAGKREGIAEIIQWLRDYAIHGGKTPLSDVIADLETHSPYSPR